MALFENFAFFFKLFVPLFPNAFDLLLRLMKQFLAVVLEPQNFRGAFLKRLVGDCELAGIDPQENLFVRPIRLIIHYLLVYFIN